MSLVPSLLQAIVRVDGEALVMHVGEKPYVVSPNGQIDLATRGLTFDAVNGLVAQLLSHDALTSLEEVGATQYELPPLDDFPGERFTVTAARGGDDVWAEIRRRVSHDEELAPPALFPTLSSTPAGSQPEFVPLEDDDLSLPQEGQLWPDAHPRVEVARQPDASDDDLRVVMPEFPGAVAEPPAPPIAAVPTAVPMVAPATPSAAPVTAPVASAPVAPPPVAPPSPTPPPVAPAVETHIADAFEQPADRAADTHDSEPNDSQKAIASWLAAFSPASMRQRPEAAMVPEPPVVSPPPALEPSTPPAEPVTFTLPAEPVAVTPAAPVAVRPTAPVLVTPPAAPPAAAEGQATGVKAAANITPVTPPVEVTSAASAATRPATAPNVENDDLRTPLSSPAVLVKPSIVPDRESEAEMSTSPPQFVPFPSLAEQPQSATVLPMARGGRDAVAAEASAAPLERLLRLAASRGATALFLSCGSRPSVRLDGDVQVLDGSAVLSAQEIESLLLGAAAERTADSAQSASSEWVWEIADLGSVRCSTFRDHRGPGAVFRIVAVRPQSAAQLGLSREIQALAAETEGLVLVSGPRGGGKSTMIATLVDLINRTRREYVITIESEVNVVHDRNGAFISQREVRGGSDEVVAAARAALREDPDVLVIDDLRNSAVMSVALDAASSGQLVIAGVTAHHASGAAERLIDLYHPEHRRHVQLSLAQNLRGVVSQVLLRKSGGGRVAAREILLNTPIVSSLLAEGRLAQLPVAIEGGRKSGMVPMNDALVGFVQSGAVDVREAYRRAVDRAGLLDLLKRQGIDTSFVERLA